MKQQGFNHQNYVAVYLFSCKIQAVLCLLHIAFYFFLEKKYYWLQKRYMVLYKTNMFPVWQDI